MRFVAVLTLAGLVACQTTVPAGTTLVINQVHVIPMDRDTVLRNHSVLVADDRIVGVRPGPVEVDETVEVLDGNGGYLMPGLWDMHVHALGDADRVFPELLHYGITGVRDMGSFLDSLTDVRERLTNGQLVGPRLVAAGPLWDGPRFQWSHAIARHFDSAQQVRAAFDELDAAGVDFLKVYNTLPRDAYLELAGLAAERNLPFAGHIPLSIRAREASDLGQVSFEHGGLDITTLDCVSDGGSRMGRLLGVWGAEGYDAYLKGMMALRAERDAACVDDLFGAYRNNGTFVTPTIVNTVKDSASVNWSAIETLPQAQRDACVGTVASFSQATDSTRHQYHRQFLDDIGALHRAGVALLAGTDVPNPCVVPGVSLHDELRWLVEAGLTPFEAIRTATMVPAGFLHIADDAGSVSEGKVADLILLRDNPLQDISATMSISAVLRAGRRVPRPAR